MKVGFLHPGMMGGSLGAACTGTAIWASEGRSAATGARAEAAGLVDVDTIDELCRQADVVVSICPPASAPSVAGAVAATGFDRVYVDANAIAPATSRSIGDMFERYVDGSVIGPPARQAGTTRLYLSGSEADAVAALWRDTIVDARIVAGDAGAASALKMSYAAWTKISSALHLAIRALAADHGIDEALVDEWNLSQPGLSDRSEPIAAGVGPKAWRFVGEMEEIAASFDDAGLPSGFAAGAAELYAGLADLKHAESPDLAAVLDMLLDRPA